MKIKEFRHMDAYALRMLCIHSEWFTRGDNEAYDALLKMSGNRRRNITAEVLYEIAACIEEHSDTNTDVCDIMSDLSGICYSTFVAEMEEEHT